jgi:hypothetical protein
MYACMYVCMDGDMYGCRYESREVSLIMSTDELTRAYVPVCM